MIIRAKNAGDPDLSVMYDCQKEELKVSEVNGRCLIHLEGANFFVLQDGIMVDGFQHVGNDVYRRVETCITLAA